MALSDVTASLFYGVAWLNILGWATVILLIGAWITKPDFWPRVREHLGRYATRYALVVAMVATLGSLWLSEIGNIPPCRLCWFQRIFMYPLVLLFSLSWWKSLPVRTYSLWMSGVGGVIALYHYGVQRLSFLEGSVQCLADASCSQMYLGYWGFYSIPLMALTAFVMVFVVMLFAKERAESNL